MKEDNLNIHNYISYSLHFLNLSFMNKNEEEGINLFDIYPYIFSYVEEIDDMNFDEKVIENLNDIYEGEMLQSLKKDFGQFYTKENIVIDRMLESCNLLKGKILEPSSGTGLFVIRIIEKIIKQLQSKNYTSESILDYIIRNVYANDLDVNATIITEINMLATVLPLIIDARNKNKNYQMKKFKVSNYDFLEKGVFGNDFSLVIGNPPFVTLYGRRSRNMSENKRTFYNTFDFVEDKTRNNKFNLSMFFVENGLKCLTYGGMLSFVMDITFFETAFKDLRKYLVQNYYIDSLVTGLQEFEGVASGQLLINIVNKREQNPTIKIIDYSIESHNIVNQRKWNNSENQYSFFTPLNSIQNQINEKINKFEKLDHFFPGKSLRTCCALTGKTEEFIIKEPKDSDCIIFPYIEGSKGLKDRFSYPEVQRYIKYDYELQIKISNDFKKELEIMGVKNKKRVTLGDKDAYLSPKLFIRQSATKIISTFCVEPFAANNSIYILSLKQKDKKSINLLKYTCGILNSNLITFYCRINRIIRMENGKTPQIKISDLKKIRLNFSEVYFYDIINLVEKLSINPSDSESFHHLNELVYKLYNISKDEKEYIKEYLEI